MWRSIKAQKSQRKFFLALFSQAYRLAGVRVFTAELSELPLITALLGTAWVLGWDWRLLVLAPLALLASAQISSIRYFHQTLRVYDQLVALYAKRSRWRFTPITTAEYLEALYRDAPPPASDGAGGEQAFARRMLPASEYYLGERLRLIVLEMGEEARLGVLATFATLDRAWVFLDGPPGEMDGFEHFKVLHEVGHTDPAGMHLSYASRGQLTWVLLTMPVLAVMVRWDVTTAALFTAHLLVFLSAAKFTVRRLARRLRFAEEVYADDFALERCPRHWFENFSAQNVKDFAAMICGNASPREGHPHGSPIYDAPLTDNEVKWRRIILVNKINQMVKGDDYVAEETVPVLSIRLLLLLSFCQQVALIVLSVVIGLRPAELTTTRFVALIVVMSVIVLAGFVVTLIGNTLATYWDKQLNAKQPSEMSDSERTLLESHERGLRWREHFEAWKGEREDSDIDNDILAPGTTGRLFRPDELDIFVDRQKSQAFIFHGKVIDYAISHLEYVPQGRSLVVVMTDGTRLDLGVKLRWLVRPHFLKADEVRIARTEERSEVEGITVPLRKGT